jgi:hypothetical protein
MTRGGYSEPATCASTVERTKRPTWQCPASAAAALIAASSEVVHVVNTRSLRFSPSASRGRPCLVDASMLFPPGFGLFIVYTKNFGIPLKSIAKDLRAMDFIVS